MLFQLSREALEAMTDPQKKALLRVANQRVRRVAVQKGGFDLPDGYLAFRQDYEEGVQIYGGIAPSGEVST